MTDLQTRLTHANPVSDDDFAPSFEDLWRRFESTTVPQRQSRRRLPRTTATGRRLRLARWATVGAAAVAAVVAVLVVGTTGRGPTSAFAGWSASPTAPASGQLQAAEAACGQRSPALSSLTPTVADTRGPFSLLLYAVNNASSVCVTGLPTGTLIGETSGGGTANATAVAADAIEPAAGQLGVMVADGQAFRFLTGQAGANVTGVTLALDDGSNVQATVANGWFAAWWPGTQGVPSAEVTTASGTTTQQVNMPAWRQPSNLPGGPTQG